MTGERPDPKLDAIQFEVVRSALVQVAEEMALRYMGPNGPTYIGRTVDRPRCLIAVTPDSIVSWAGGEWHPRYSRGD